MHNSNLHVIAMTIDYRGARMQSILLTTLITFHSVIPTLLNIYPVIII